MVIPMQMPQNMMSGPPPEQAAGALKNLKYAVLVLGAACIGRALFAIALGVITFDMFHILNIVGSFCIGAFLLKEDEHLARAYKVMSEGPCSSCAQQGMGGMQCLMPFLMVNAVHFVMDLLTAGRVFNPKLQPYGLFLGATIVAEGAASYFAWTVYKITRDLAPADGMELGMGASGGFVQTGDNDAPSALQAAGFTPFAGSGNRLGG
eukprot:TRINITY_DN2849_c0_g4_i1.p2 TRINITY_DN2849_c0_g4~~TRINITY_DN2849_c0_g4_i1.p2  ORF type:complete len:207 (-),score=42.62 TRINITY_DN2849_c0_g4_i1:74-694(-)